MPFFFTQRKPAFPKFLPKSSAAFRRIPDRFYFFQNTVHKKITLDFPSHRCTGQGLFSEFLLSNIILFTSLSIDSMSPTTIILVYLKSFRYAAPEGLLLVLFSGYCLRYFSLSCSYLLLWLYCSTAFFKLQYAILYNVISFFISYYSNCYFFYFFYFFRI